MNTKKQFPALVLDSPYCGKMTERSSTMSDGQIIRIADILTIAGTLLDAMTE